MQKQRILMDALLLLQGDMGTDREMDADMVEQRGCEGAGQARDRQTEEDWEQAWREDAGMIARGNRIASGCADF